MDVKLFAGILVRHALSAAGVYLVSRGYVSADEWNAISAGAVELIVGGVLTVASLLWSVVNKRQLVERRAGF